MTEADEAEEVKQEEEVEDKIISWYLYNLNFKPLL